MSTVCTFHNAEVVVDDLGQGGEAVGGAGGVGHNVVARLVLLVVHTLKTHLYKLETEPAVLWIRLRIRIQHFKCIRIQGFDDQKFIKMNYFLSFWINNSKKRPP
jgi:hypothetical protein